MNRYDIPMISFGIIQNPIDHIFQFGDVFLDPKCIIVGFPVFHFRVTFTGFSGGSDFCNELVEAFLTFHENLQFPGYLELDPENETPYILYMHAVVRSTSRRGLNPL